MSAPRRNAAEASAKVGSMLKEMLDLKKLILVCTAGGTALPGYLIKVFMQYELFKNQ